MLLIKINSKMMLIGITSKWMRKCTESQCDVRAIIFNVTTNHLTFFIRHQLQYSCGRGGGEGRIVFRCVLLHWTHWKWLFCLTPLVSWGWGLIPESLAWYVWSSIRVYSVRWCQISFITRQQREAGLTRTYHFHKIRLCFNFFGQQVLCFVAWCSQWN